GRGGAAVDALLEGFEDSYQAFKAAVLRAGSAGEVAPRRMVVVLEYGSILRRICGQAAKATAYLDRYFNRDAAAAGAGTGEAPAPAGQEFSYPPARTAPTAAQAPAEHAPCAPAARSGKRRRMPLSNRTWPRP